MAIAVDQATIGTAANDASAASIALTTTRAVAANGFIELEVTWGTDIVTLSSVSGGGLTWTIDKQGSSVNKGGNCAAISAQAPSGLASGTALTATFSGATVGRGISGSSDTGVATSSPVDTTSGPTNFSGTTAWTTASTTIAAGSKLKAIAHCSTTNDTSTITSPSIEAQDFGGGAGTFGQTVGYRIEAAGGAYVVAGTWSGSEQGTVIAVAYKAAAGGGSNKAVTPAAVNATSAVTASVQRIAAVTPAAVTSSSPVTASLVALKQFQAAVAATSTVTAAATRIASLHVAAVNATSSVGAAISGIAQNVLDNFRMKKRRRL